MENAKAFFGLDLDITGSKQTTRPVAQISIIEPRSFLEAESIASLLLDRTPVLINLAHIDDHEGNRLLEFLAGSLFAIDGEMVRVSKLIYLTSPSSTAINYVEKSQ